MVRRAMIRKTIVTVALLLSTILVSQIALPRATLAAPTNSPSATAEQRLKLVRLLVFEHLATLNDACQLKNFSVLRAKASPNFREKYSEEMLNVMFPHCGPRALDMRRFLLQKVVLSDFAVDQTKGLLGMKGHIDESDLRLGFELQFESVGGQWKLSVIELELTRQNDRGRPST